MSSVRLVFDIGGTNMRIALAEDDKIKVGEKLPTPHDPKGGIDAIRSFLEQHDAHPSEAAGGIASTVKDGATLYAPNLGNGTTSDSSILLKRSAVSRERVC